MIAGRVAELLGTTATDPRPVGGGCSCPAYRVRTAAGPVFAKTRPEPPPGFFAVEADGLRWLGEAVPGLVPAVLAVAADVIVLEWVEQAAPTPAAAERFGRELAALHRAGAPGYGAPRPGYIGLLPLDNTAGSDWPAFYGSRRLVPYLRRAVDAGAIGADDRRAVEAVVDRLPELAGPPQPPARLHGDLWSGNVLWTADGVRLVDPAAHGGHRETDLAMLALFGAPLLDRVIAAYDSAYPLAAGWRGRAAVHQLHPLLVHAALFGGGYGAQAGQVARAALAAG